MFEKAIFTEYVKNKKELLSVEKRLRKLQNSLESVEDVSGKVEKSSDSFPYIKEHITVQIPDPKESDRIKKRILEKETRKTELLKKISAVEDFIDQMQPGIDKEMFEMLFLDGMTQKEVGDELGFERSSISKRVDAILNLSHHSHS